MAFIVTDDATTASRQKRPAAGGGRPERCAGGVANFARGTTPRVSPLLPSAPLQTITSLQSECNRV